MRSVTTPLFPAQIEGAVTLQALIDAREGNRLPLELAMYLSGELSRQVTQLQALGRAGSLDPNRVWCTSKGAVVVHESAPGEAHGLGPLIYRLLSGSGEVSAWPPSYFNPSVAEAVDVAVMSAVNTANPQDTQAMLEVLNAAAIGLDQEASITGMARLVFAVSDDSKSVPAPLPALVVARSSAEQEVDRAVSWPQRARAWGTPRRFAFVGGAGLVLIAAMIALAVGGRTRVEVTRVEQPVKEQAVAIAAESPSEVSQPKKQLKMAIAKAPASKKGRGKAK